MPDWFRSSPAPDVARVGVAVVIAGLAGVVAPARAPGPQIADAVAFTG